MTRIYESYDWDAEKSDQITHEAMEDLRKTIYLYEQGYNASKNGAENEPRETQFAENKGPIHFAPRWEDTLQPYPASDVVYDNIVGTPTSCEKSTEQYRGVPGERICWYERSWEHSLLGVIDSTEPLGEFKFARTQKSSYAIYGQNGCTIKAAPPGGTAGAGQQETWTVELDDFRPGTPFIIRDSDDPANDGFYRVRESRDDGFFVYVIPDNNNYEQKEIVVCDSGGNAACNPKENEFDEHGIWGGEWYIFRGENGNSNGGKIQGKYSGYFANFGDDVYMPTISEDWWSQKDEMHRYEPVAYADDSDPSNPIEYEATFGPNDARPPDGGYCSKDFNGDWARAINPNIYYNFDANSHRFHIESDWTGDQYLNTDEQYSYLSEAKNFLNAQTDAKEVISPFKFEDSGASRWKYNGKVKLKTSQITDADNLGTTTSVKGTGYVTQSNTKIPTSTDHQYVTTHLYDAGGSNSGFRTQDGYLYWSDMMAPRPRWIDYKDNDAIQNAVESICGRVNWQFEADDEYITNWFDLHDGTSPIERERGEDTFLNDAEEDHWYGTQTGTKTYANLFIEKGVSAWLPKFNQYMLRYPPGNDSLWGENGSTFELVLKFLGPSHYDWYFDKTFPYMSKDLLDQGWLWKASRGVNWDSSNLPGTFNGVFCTTASQVQTACWPPARGVWRRTFKRSLGRVDNSRMREGGRPDPDIDVYQPYSAHPDNPSVHSKMYGRFVMFDEPEPDEYYVWSQGFTITGDGITTPSFVINGNRTDRFQQGWRVFDFVDNTYPTTDVYTSYLVLKVEYDSDADETNVWMDAQFHIDEPSMLYGDDYLSINHDAQAVVEGVEIFSKNVYKILNDCRDILFELNYKKSPGVVLLRDSGEIYPFFELNPFGAPPYPFEAPTKGESRDRMIDWMLDFYENVDILQGTGYTDGYVAKRESHYYTDSLGYWWFDGGSWSTMSRLTSIELRLPAAEALRILDNNNLSNGKEVYILLAGHSDNEYDETTGNLWPRHSTPGFQGLAGVTVDKDGFFYYDDANLNTDGVVQVKYYESDDTYGIGYLLYPLLWPWNPPEYNIFGGVNQWGGIETHCRIDLVENTDFMTTSDWNAYPDIIWKRGTERADWGLVDFNGADTEAPVDKNLFQDVPMVFDANYEVFGDITTWSDEAYVAEWRIVCSSVHMEDESQNGVEYIYNFSPSVANPMDKTQDDSHYNEILDMGEGATPGDDDDAEYAWKNGLVNTDPIIPDWTGTTNTKDNASVRPINPTDNTGVASVTSDVILHPDIPLFPARAVWAYDSDIGQSPIQDTFDEINYYDWVAVDKPANHSYAEYKIEKWDGVDTWDVIYGYDDLQPTPPAGAGTPQTQEGMYWIPADENDYNEYRVVYHDNDSQVEGIYSTEEITQADQPIP